MTDPIKSLLTDAAEDLEQRTLWLSYRMGELIRELEEAGFEAEDIPKALADYAAWMLANMDLWNGRHE